MNIIDKYTLIKQHKRTFRAFGRGQKIAGRTTVHASSDESLPVRLGTPGPHPSALEEKLHIAGSIEHHSQIEYKTVLEP